MNTFSLIVSYFTQIVGAIFAGIFLLKNDKSNKMARFSLFGLFVLATFYSVYSTALKESQKERLEKDNAALFTQNNERITAQLDSIGRNINNKKKYSKNDMIAMLKIEIEENIRLSDSCLLALEKELEVLDINARVSINPEKLHVKCWGELKAEMSSQFDTKSNTYNKLKEIYFEIYEINNIMDSRLFNLKETESIRKIDSGLKTVMRSLKVLLQQIYKEIESMK